MTAISREQFIRSFDALKASQERRDRINAAMNDDSQSFPCDIGTDPAVWELQQLLEAWTRDRWDDNGPWPEDACGEGDISLGLSPIPMGIHDHLGNELPHRTTAEDIWAMWERTKTGPFREMRK